MSEGQVKIVGRYLKSKTGEPQGDTKTVLEGELRRTGLFSEVACEGSKLAPPRDSKIKDIYGAICIVTPKVGSSVSPETLRNALGLKTPNLQKDTYEGNGAVSAFRKSIEQVVGMTDEQWPNVTCWASEEQVTDTDGSTSEIATTSCHETPRP